MFLFGVLAGVVCGVVVAFIVASSRRRESPAEITWLKSDIQELEQSIQSLQQLSGKYFDSITPIDVNRLDNIYSRLQQVEELCESLRSNGADEEAAQITDYVSRGGGSGQAPTCLQERLGEDVQGLADWRLMTEQTLSEIIERVNSTSEAVRQIGQVSPRKRAPTSVLLGELRSAIAVRNRSE